MEPILLAAAGLGVATAAAALTVLGYVAGVIIAPSLRRRIKLETLVAVGLLAPVVWSCSAAVVALAGTCAGLLPPDASRTVVVSLAVTFIPALWLTHLVLEEERRPPPRRRRDHF